MIKITIILMVLSEVVIADCSPFVPSCKSAFKDNLILINQIVQHIQTTKLSDLEKEKDGIDFSEVRIDDKVKCIYQSNVAEPGQKKEKKRFLYANNCVNFVGEAKVISTSTNWCDNHPKIENISGEGRKQIKKYYVDLRYAWEIGECSLDSEKYFENLKSSTSVKKLEKNMFLLVSENDKYLTYYANPGYIVKLIKDHNKCEKSKNCELKIELKKRLKSAILDVNGKLHTDESI